jgi:hypothetical protein
VLLPSIVEQSESESVKELLPLLLCSFSIRNASF